MRVLVECRHEHHGEPCIECDERGYRLDASVEDDSIELAIAALDNLYVNTTLMEGVSSKVSELILALEAQQIDDLVVHAEGLLGEL